MNGTGRAILRLEEVMVSVGNGTSLKFGWFLFPVKSLSERKLEASMKSRNGLWPEYIGHIPSS